MMPTIPSFVIAAFFAPASARLTVDNPDFKTQLAQVKELVDAASHEFEQPSPTYDAFEVQSSLDAHRNIWWGTVGEGGNYDMTFERACACPESYRGPFVVHIRSGQVESATYLNGGEVVDVDTLGGLLTVEGVMNEIQKGLDRHYVEMHVTYDNTGYPSSFHSNSGTMIADNERTYKISDVMMVEE